MKKQTIAILFLFHTQFAFAQNAPDISHNYVQTRTYLEAVSTSSANNKQFNTVEYFNGFGKIKQVINVKGSPLGNDVVTHVTHDEFERQALEYLPVPQTNSTNGDYYSDPLLNATDPEIYGSEIIFSKKIFENSPLNRVLHQVHEGTAWENKPISFEYKTNQQEDNVKMYETSTVWIEGRTETSIFLNQNFLPNKLYKNIISDEDENITIEFKNSKNQVILVRKILGQNKYSDTYYVYNQFNQLAYVIPPLGVEAVIDDMTVNNQYYQYRYDLKGRLVEKKLPGKGWEYMVYDKADRLILTQDANLRQTEKWMVTKYDNFGRVIYTGLIPRPNETREALQNVAKNHIIVEGREGTGFSRNGLQIYYTNGYYYEIETVLSVNYYDSYLPGDPFPTMVYDQVVLPPDVQQYGVSTKGQLVSSFVKNIEDDNWTKTYHYYDLKGRPIRKHSFNHLGGYTNVEKRLDFSGNPDIILTQHKRLSTDIERVITETFTYDHQNRLLTHKHKVDNNPEEILAQNEYNELSQLKTKKVGGKIPGNGLQLIDYRYNIRGWLTQINDPNNLGTDLFGYKINYNQIEGLTMPHSDFPSLLVKPTYNGNIAEISWKSLTEENEPLKRYGYVYDNLNRLNAGFYQKSGTENAQEYYERLEYDLNGNITRLQRSAGLAPGSNTAIRIDNLAYEYTGSRLTKVTEEQIGNNNGYPYLVSHNMIEYDNNLPNGNGNMTKHLDKGISKIVYNYLNLPTNITSGSGKKQSNVAYLYRADGTKLAKFTGGIFSNRQVDYLDGFQYDSIVEFCIGCPTQTVNLKFVPTAEGYFDFEKNQYIYNYVDHLGNVRMGYSDSNGDNFIQPRDLSLQHCEDLGDGNFACFNYWIPGEVVEVNNYYPFGLLHNYMGSTLNSYQYKYNGKELQETGMYDYGARFYMPDIGRWGVADPLAEKFQDWSTYNYTMNNPINMLDPTGMEAEHIDVTKNKDGSYKVVGGKANSDKNIYVVNENGKRTGEVLGQMLTEYSFHNEDGSAVKGATIDLNDSSGQNFFNDEIRNVGLFYYIGNAKGNEPLDFKNRGINDRDQNITAIQYQYRGMSFNNKVASARDIGNYAAGYVAGRYGLGWSVSRFGFDALQTKQDKGLWNTFLYYPFNRVNEGQPTQRAERAGHTDGSKVFNISQKFKNALTVPSNFRNPIRRW